MLSPINAQHTETLFENTVNKNNSASARGSSFIEALVQAADSSKETNPPDIINKELTKADMLQAIRNKICEMQTKLESGETEPTFQIGGRTFTDKEWKDLIRKIDKALEKYKKKVENNEKKNNEITEKDNENNAKQPGDSEIAELIEMLLHEE